METWAEGGALQRGSTERFVLAVDDVGDLLTLVGRALTIGHAAAAEPDLGLLGDIDSVHGRLALRDSFHGGLEWAFSVVPGAAPVEIDGVEHAASAGGRALHDGDRVRFGQAAVFLCRQPDPSSASMILEMEGRTDAGGCRRVALLVPGIEGRVRFGARVRRHVVIPGLTHDVAIVAHSSGSPGDRPGEGPGDRPGDAGPILTFSCEGGVRRPGSAAGGSASSTALSLRLPIEERVDLAFGAAPDRLPPFGMAVRPAAGSPRTR